MFKFIDRPIFILSAPRAGSTLLFDTLARAKSLYTIGGESHEIIEGLSPLSVGPKGVRSNRLDTGNADAEIVRQIHERFLEKLLDREGNLFSQSKLQAARMLEKTPKNSLRIPFLKEIFPEACFIYLYRDPRENISSIMEAWRSGKFITYQNLPDWEGTWSLLLPPGYGEQRDKPLVEVAAFQWISANQYILDDLSVLPAECWTSVSYNNFTSAPADEIRRICEFMQISMDPQLEEFIYKSRLPISRNALTAPEKNKWRKNERAINTVLPEIASLYQQILTTTLPSDQASLMFDQFNREYQAGALQGPHAEMNMKVTSQPRTILVFGMHRSGTSALTGALAKAGICAGDETTLYGADQNNEKGFYEQRELVDINEEILIRNFLAGLPDSVDDRNGDAIDVLNGFGWLFGVWQDQKNLAAIALEKTEQRIVNFLSKLWSANSHESRFIIKDPRLSFTFPYWSKHIDKPIILIMARNPADVAKSLGRRDQIDAALSHELWGRYLYAAMLNSLGHQSYVIDYDRLIEFPETMMGELFKWLNLKGLELTDEMQAEAIRFISPALRHHKVNQNKKLPGETLDYYEQLRELFPFVPEEHITETRFCSKEQSWQSIVYLLARKFREGEARLLHAEMVHQRLTRHPLAGKVISTLSKVKKDDSFGALDYHLLSDD